MQTTALPECYPFRSAEARDRYLAHYDERAESWPVASETRMVHTDHGQTFVRISGPVDGPPLVLFPGIWSDSLMWPTAMTEAFSQAYRVYAVDNVYDFGRSVNARPKTSAAEYVAWLDGLFDALGLDNGINIVGCSLGAWIAAEYVLHAPQRLAKVVWLSPGGIVLSRALDGPCPAHCSPQRAFWCRRGEQPAHSCTGSCRTRRTLVGLPRVSSTATSTR